MKRRQKKRQRKIISREQAAEIAYKLIARQLVDIEVYSRLPAGYSVYWLFRPKNCWYVICGLREPRMTGGRPTLLCICKRTGRLLYSTVAGCE